MCHDFEERIKRIIKGCLDEVDIEKINEETNLVDDYNATSIDIVQIIVDLENEFGIEFPEEYLLIEKIAPYKVLASIMEELLLGVVREAKDDQI